MVLFTFADGQRPPAIAAMEKAEIPCRLFCKMNNSALYASNNDDVHNKFIDEMFWNMGMASMMDLFDTLQTMSPKSLTLTQNVLNRRSQLRADVEALQQETRRGLAKLNECKQEWDIVQKNNSMINDNKEFKYKATEIKMRKETYKSGYDTNCPRRDHSRKGIFGDEGQVPGRHLGQNERRKTYEPNQNRIRNHSKECTHDHRQH